MVLGRDRPELKRLKSDLKIYYLKRFTVLPAAHWRVIENVWERRERIDQVMPLIREYLLKVQQSQQRHYNWPANGSSSQKTM